jgi:hypothetical protein
MADTCAHAPCHCDPEGSEYCSLYCRDVALTKERRPTCECGHVDCEEATMRTGGVYTTARR